MGADMEFEGVGDLIAQLSRINGEIEQVVDDALQAGASPILEEARQTGAFRDRTGTLRKSLKISKTKIKKNQKYVLIGSFSSKAFYDRYIEFGTSKMPARPFMRPAFERHKEEATEIIKKHLVEAINNGL